MRYMVVIEKGENSFGAVMFPILPGCVAVAEQRKTKLKNLSKKQSNFTLKIWRKQAYQLRSLCRKANKRKF